jgi:protein phosphatase
MRLPLTDVELPATERVGGSTSASAPRRCLAVRSHGLTDKGRVRSSNEDQFLVAVLTKVLQVQSSLDEEDLHYSGPQGHLFVVADGVGGHAAGEKASALAVRTIEDFVLDTLHWCHRLSGTDQLLADFRDALKRADENLFLAARDRPELRGMGTTLTLAYALGDELYIAHVGDSRCYLLRNNLLYLLTRDHTLVAEMVRRGVLQRDEAARHSMRHVVVNVVGGSDRGVQVEVHKLPLEVGDRLLLCSDGLTEMVKEEEVASILQAEPEPDSACQRLVATANENGGKDNVTVVVAHFGE